jgi:hypothetical protein
MDMTTFKIECNYELPAFVQEAIGLRLDTILAQNGSVFLGNPISLSCLSNVILKFTNDRSWMIPAPLFQLFSRGHESYAGNLFGAEIARNDRHEYDVRNPESNPHQGYALHFSSKNFGKVVKIVGIGEVRKEDVVTAGQEEDVECFFPKGSVLPDIISIDKRTLEAIGFLFDTGKWLYIFPNGEGDLGFDVDVDISPEELISNWETLDDEPKPLLILQVFE